MINAVSDARFRLLNSSDERFFLKGVGSAASIEEVSFCVFPACGEGPIESSKVSI